MIELYFKDNQVKKVQSVDEITYQLTDLFNVRIIDFSQNELNALAQKFGLNLTIFNQKEDIEISSHFLNLSNQLVFNFSIPSYSSQVFFEEEEVFIIIKSNVVFYFLTTKMDRNLTNLTKSRYDFDSINFNSHLEHFVFQIGVISDYYADLTELISKRIKQLFLKTLEAKQFVENDLDLITRLNFNNLLVKESINNFQRILILLIRSGDREKIINQRIGVELDDIAVITEHLQYNFERLDDLKENINSKIDLEQNRIFKSLTIITVCISLPTLIAAIYGMNFQQMPELHWQYGYPLSLALMGSSFLAAIAFFKLKKWL
ncbi:MULTISPECIES: CorA family divalent cation transporter [unclassified Aureispira]|uniref:CorA family divalent cation transporter n=1 Tax=unclassified Aureispira TaxID=2649989 RepID=UPI000698786B|nr:MULTISPECIES: CorA family divalent cation transporter [unclassified Aureispira]WMX16413.1 CorA family divalent cation transporter [Aureispira sp. CCB-E]